MNNITAIKAMNSWINQNGRTPAPENYIDLYLDKVGLDNVVDDDSNYDTPDQVLNYTEKDMDDEISSLDNTNNYFHTEDMDLEDWGMGMKSSLENI
jgi:hypothetical protein